MMANPIGLLLVHFMPFCLFPFMLGILSYYLCDYNIFYSEWNE